MPTIHDVARLAGVSISTVSLATNAPARVSAATRARIEVAARTVGYAPDAVARSLKRGRSQLIGFVVNDITNPFFGTALQRMETRVAEAGYLVIVSDTRCRPDAEIEILRHLTGHRVAGIALSPSLPYLAPAPHIDALSMPFVLFDHKLAQVAGDFVGTDNAAASALLVRHLIGLGHRRIAYIGGTAGLWTADERQRGFREAMAEGGVPVEEELIVDARYGQPEAQIAARGLLEDPARRPTAVIAASNVMAIGTLLASIELGLNCPREVSIAGIDDLPWSSVIQPRITMTVQPVERLADRMTDLLLERIGGGAMADAPPREVILPPRLLIGGSTASL